MMEPKLSLISSKGHAVKLAWHKATPILGVQGIGVAPTTLEVAEGAGNGGVPRFSRRGVKDIDIPIFLEADDRLGIQTRMDEIMAALRWRPGRKEPKLRYETVAGPVFEINCHYVGGAETVIDEGAGATFCKWLLTLRCPDPFWRSADEVSFTIRVDQGVTGILPHIYKLAVGSSQVIGDVVVTNPGTVETPITWRVTGPGGPFTAENEFGDRFEITTVLGQGDVRVIDTLRGTVTDDSGNNRYDELGDAPKLWALPPGKSTVKFTLPSATSESSVVGVYRPARELVY